MIEYKVRVYFSCTEWFLNGVLHRENGPAIEWANGDKEGELHRLDGPAIEWANGYKCWCKEGKYHRLDCPAIEYSSGSKEWWKEGKLHRDNGPAIEYANGYQSWYIEGKMYAKEEFDKKIREINPPSCDGKIVEIEGKKYELKEIK